MFFLNFIIYVIHHTVLNIIFDEHLYFFILPGKCDKCCSQYLSIFSLSILKEFIDLSLMCLKLLTYSIFWKIKISCLRWIIVNERASCLIFELHCHIALWAERILILMKSFFSLSSFPWNSMTVFEKETRILLHLWGSSKVLALKIEILKIV